MNIPIHQQPSPWRYLWLIVLIGLPALGWYGILDDFSSKDINNSITNAGLIYGTARGINALVSVLQGTELNLVVMTFSIGEILDPVNDLIERFSDVILLALGSLALQKILLALVSQKLFNILLSGVAVFAGISLFIRKPRFLPAMLRIFLVIAFFRFSLGLVVLANSWVDATFLDEADQQRHHAMKNFEGQLRLIETLSQKATEAASILAEEQKVLGQLQHDQTAQKSSLETLNMTIQGLDNRLAVESKKASWICAKSINLPMLSPDCPEAVKKIGIQLDGYQSQQEDLQSNLDDIDANITNSLEKIECLKKRMNGEKCHFYEVLPDVPNFTEIRMKINEIGARVGAFAENTINLLVSLLLKSIAIPVLFFYILLKIIRVNWERI